MTRNYLVAAALAAMVTSMPLAAQTSRAIMLGVYGGGYDHLLNLNDAGGTHGTADFTPGHSFGTTLGVQLNRYVALHGDFTYARNRAAGDESFAGGTFDRFFYGAHIEMGYPLPGGLTPYLFVGGGAVTIDELGSNATISPFTKPAAMLGTGFFYPIAGRFEIFAEGKQLIYKWDRGDFAPIPGDVMTSEGQVYHVSISTGRLERTQWDMTYTLGVSYRLKTATHHTTPTDRSDAE